jgi:hypothetical protein
MSFELSANQKNLYFIVLKLKKNFLNKIFNGLDRKGNPMFFRCGLASKP